VIAAVMIVNAIIGFIQEGKAEKALNAIRSMIAPSALVLRDGQRTKVAVRDLVPGDIVLLEAGDKVPADLRLLRARRLLIDEALLTGESVAVEKDEAFEHRGCVGQLDRTQAIRQRPAPLTLGTSRR
jgi:P-type E1-E2 ATPase